MVLVKDVGFHKTLVSRLYPVVMSCSTILYFFFFRPAWTSSINSFRVEACWRLGQWDELESYAKLVEYHDCQILFPVFIELKMVAT